MESKHTALTMIFVGFLAFTWVIVDTALESKTEKTGVEQQGGGGCWPIHISRATGTINCWSGGVPVYSKLIYHNGGVLCAIDGSKVTVLDGGNLCVVESNQLDVWEPPARQNQ